MIREAKMKSSKVEYNWGMKIEHSQDDIKGELEEMLNIFK